MAYNPPGVTSFGLRRAGGSGVIVSADGYIVTNAHVVAGATRIHVQLSSNGAPAGRSIVRPPGRVSPARLVGLDAGSRPRTPEGGRRAFATSLNSPTPISFGKVNW